MPKLFLTDFDFRHLLFIYSRLLASGPPLAAREAARDALPLARSARLAFAAMSPRAAERFLSLLQLPYDIGSRHARSPRLRRSLVILLEISRFVRHFIAITMPSFMPIQLRELSPAISSSALLKSAGRHAARTMSMPQQSHASANYCSPHYDAARPTGRLFDMAHTLVRHAQITSSTSSRVVGSGHSIRHQVLISVGERENSLLLQMSMLCLAHSNVRPRIRFAMIRRRKPTMTAPQKGTLE